MNPPPAITAEAGFFFSMSSWIRSMSGTVHSRNTFGESMPAIGGSTGLPPWARIRAS